MKAIIADWKKVDRSSPRGRALLAGAVNAFLSPERVLGDIKRIEMMTVKGDIPDGGLEYADVFHQMDPFDFGWQPCFKLVDLRNSNKDYINIADVSTGLAFSVVPEGHSCEVYKISGEKTTVFVQTVGGGLGWSNIMFDDQDFYSIEGITTEFRNKYYKDQSQTMYDLISASRADSDLAWQGASADPRPTRDAETINTAMVNIILACDSVGYNDVSANSSFRLVAPMQLKSRITAALKNLQENAVSGGVSGGAGGEVLGNITPTYTTMLKNQALSAAETAKYFVILPGRKMHYALKQDLSIKTQDEILVNGETWAGWGRYVGAIGDTNQLLRCATS